MPELEGKLEAILGNPQMMQQIMSMAQSLGAQQAVKPGPDPPHQEPNLPAMPSLDPAMLQKLASLAGQGTIDNNQKSLLCALGPYLSQTRIHKLEKAMRAAKIASLASVFLSQGGLSFLTGR